jgi:hypothetical protein
MAASADYEVLSSVLFDKVSHRDRVSTGGSGAFHNSLPVSTSKPRIKESVVPATNTSPPAVMIGPPITDRTRWNLLRVRTAEILHRA